MNMPHLNRKYPGGAAKRRMKFKANLVFQIFLVVVYGFMHSHKDMNVNKFSLPTTKHFIKGEVRNFQRGKPCSSLMVNAEIGRENKVEAMSTCCCPTSVCCQPCLSTFQCFQSCVS